MICQPSRLGALYPQRTSDKSSKIAKLLEKFDTVLGIKITEKKEENIPQEILDLVEQRKTARAEKNWAESWCIWEILQRKI